MNRIYAVLLVVTLCLGLGEATVRGATVTYWRFEPGNLTLDSSGNGNTLTNSGVASSSDVPTSAGGSAGSAYFNGASMLDTLAALDLTAYTNLTVEWFMKPAIGTTAVVFEHSPNCYSESYYGGIATYLNNGGDMNVHFNPNDLPRATIPDGTASGAWHHYAALIETNGNIQLFIDYKYVANSGPNNARSFLSQVFHIGGRQGGAFRFAGYIDELRISDRFLEPREFVGAPRTVAYWRFEPGAITNDSSGYGRDLANSGVTSSSDTMVAARGSTGSASFNGAAMLNTLATLNLTPYTNLTVEWFMKPAMASSTAAGIPWETGNPWAPEHPGAFGTYLGNADGSNPDGIMISHRRTSGTEKMTNAVPGGIAAGGAWHHYAVLISSTNTTSARMQLFIDRKAAGTWAGSYSPSATAFGNFILTIGARTGMVGPIIGLIDELRITDGLLAPGEFLYQPPKGTVMMFK